MSAEKVNTTTVLPTVIDVLGVSLSDLKAAAGELDVLATVPTLSYGGGEG